MEWGQTYLTGVGSMSDALIGQFDGDWVMSPQENIVRSKGMVLHALVVEILKCIQQL